MSQHAPWQEAHLNEMKSMMILIKPALFLQWHLTMAAVKYNTVENCICIKLLFSVVFVLCSDKKSSNLIRSDYFLAHLLLSAAAGGWKQQRLQLTHQIWSCRDSDSFCHFVTYRYIHFRSFGRLLSANKWSCDFSAKRWGPTCRNTREADRAGNRKQALFSNTKAKTKSQPRGANATR